MDTKQVPIKRKPSIFKWTVIGCLGTISAFVLLIIFLVWRFTPVIQFDEVNNRVKLFGGMVDIKDITGGNLSISSNFSYQRSKGVIDIQSLVDRSMKIQGNALNLKLVTQNSDAVDYDCRYDGANDSKTSKQLNFDFRNSSNTECIFTLPRDFDVVVIGTQTSLSFMDLQNNLDIKTEEGDIELDPLDSEKYNYNLAVDNGKIHPFVNSNDVSAYKIKVRLGKGNVAKSIKK